MTQALKSALLILIFGLTPSVVMAQSQRDMNEAALADARRADQALNAQYAATRARLSPGSRTLLRDAQRSWITFRDSHCRYEASSVEGGSVYPMIHAMCITRLTDDRTLELRRLGECVESDLSCPS